MLAVVVNWTFTSGDVDVCTHLFIDHYDVSLFFSCVKFLRLVLTNYFNSEVFLMYGMANSMMSIVSLINDITSETISQ